MSWSYLSPDLSSAPQTSLTCALPLSCSLYFYNPLSPVSLVCMSVTTYQRPQPGRKMTLLSINIHQLLVVPLRRELLLSPCWDDDWLDLDWLDLTGNHSYSKFMRATAMSRWDDRIPWHSSPFSGFYVLLPPSSLCSLRPGGVDVDVLFRAKPSTFT